MSISPEDTVTTGELAALLGVSERRVRQLAELGTLERLERGRYRLGASIRALLDEAGGSGSALNRVRTSKLQAEAEMARLELAKAKGEVAPIDTFARVQAHVATIIRTGMLNIPQRVVSQLLGESDEARFKAVLRQEIIIALTSARDEITSTNVEDIPHE
jgi:phage terminase Nu1 subunit (DNA packaging protein)